MTKLFLLALVGFVLLAACGGDTDETDDHLSALEGQLAEFSVAVQALTDAPASLTPIVFLAARMASCFYPDGD